MLLPSLFLLIGLVFLFLGGEMSVRGVEAFSSHFNLSKGFAGAVLIGFGTSMPELLTSLQAAYQGSVLIGLGNIVGSNSANIFLIGGVALLIAPMSIRAASCRLNVIFCIIFFAVILFFSFLSNVGKFAGFALIAGFAYYLFRQWQAKHKTDSEEQENIEQEQNSGIFFYAILMIGGIVALVGGAWMTVEGAVSLARYLHAPEALIGVSIVAIGTSLPELAAAIAASRKGESEIILGNILGSCIFNSSLILGAVLLVTPLSFPVMMRQIDLPVMIVGGLFLLLLIGQDRRNFNYQHGSILLGGYFFYIALIAQRFLT